MITTKTRCFDDSNWEASKVLVPTSEPLPPGMTLETEDGMCTFTIELWWTTLPTENRAMIVQIMKLCDATRMFLSQFSYEQLQDYYIRLDDAKTKPSDTNTKAT